MRFVLNEPEDVTHLWIERNTWFGEYTLRCGTSEKNSTCILRIKANGDVLLLSGKKLGSIHQSLFHEKEVA